MNVDCNMAFTRKITFYCIAVWGALLFMVWYLAPNAFPSLSIAITGCMILLGRAFLRCLRATEKGADTHQSSDDIATLSADPFLDATISATEERRHLADFEDSLSRVWHRFLEHSPIAIILLNQDAQVTESNIVFRQLTGKDESERDGWDLLEMLHPDQRAEVKTLLQKVRDGAIDQRPVEVRLKDNGENLLSLYINPMRRTDDKHLGFIAYLIDMTEQKNLELRVIHSQKMQAVGQLAGGIAHDFNNLLTAMIGFCDLLLLRHPPGEESFADIMQIKQNANRAANLVRQLLAFSRKQTLQPDVVDISDALAELSNLIRRLIGENIELSVEHGRDLWPVLADQGQLEQVIINLAVNARDAMPEGGKLTIRTGNVTVDKAHPINLSLASASHDQEPLDGEYVQIDVIDTGCGIPPSVLSQIFEPFFTTKAIGSGTGLGLSTVYGIIQQTGGRVLVSSREGQGAQFSIFLKRYSESESTPEEILQEREEPHDLTGAGTILLVEDESPVRIFSSRALTNKGYTILEADSGESALRIIEERGGEIQLIITDVVMPGISGPDMVKKVHEEYPHIEVIFMSGYGEDTFIKSYGEQRSFRFLPKPYTLNQLAAKVKEVIK